MLVGVHLFFCIIFVKCFKFFYFFYFFIDLIDSIYIYIFFFNYYFLFVCFFLHQEGILLLGYYITFF